jgi:hypothetical protein
MTTVTISSVLESLNTLSIADQLAVNKALCAMIRNGQRVKKAVVGLQFFPGQVVTFNAKTRGIKNIKIEKFNRAGTAVVGYECDKQGVQTSTMRWTVATTLCTVVAA